MSLARYSIKYFVIRYKNIGILDIFENLDFLKKYIYIYLYIYIYIYIYMWIVIFIFEYLKKMYI